ncbi:hypothetical protein XENOCAPTIV_000524, partial [Xenoophorus captivus]
VEEVKRHSHCLAFNSAGPQSQIYYVSYDSYAEHLRWHRMASKIASQRVNSVDLSCCSLEELPSQLFYSQDLTHLNLKHNFMSLQKGVPALTSLQTLLLDGNILSSLPAEMCSLEGLTYLGLSFNCFSGVPPILEKLRGMDKLCLAGNRLSVLDMAALQWLPARYIDNVTMAGSEQLLHIIQLDMRDAGLQKLDVSCLGKLELLRCDRNCLSVLRVSGHALKSLHASHNGTDTLIIVRFKTDEARHVAFTHAAVLGFAELMQLEVQPVPENLTALDLCRLPERLESSQLEVLDLQHNHLTELPHNLFIKAQRLCVAALAQDTFCGTREALYGVFDGDRNVEVPYLLQCTMGDVLAEELHRGPWQEDYMTNTFLTMQRKLGTAGQRMGGSAVLCHIRHDPVAPGEPGNCFTLKAANVGRCQAVLCRGGKAWLLSNIHTVQEESEYERDNKVGGVTDSTRMMGYSFLSPSVTPCPHISMVTLTPQDEFFLLGSRGLWDLLSPSEAVEAVRNVPDALAAAKKLVTLAQSYGCSDSLSAVVVQLNITEDCCCFCEPPPPPPSPGPTAQPTLHPYTPSGDGGISLPPASSGTMSELSSEFSTSEMSSEVGSTASSEEPPLQTEPMSTHLNAQGRAGVRRPAVRLGDVQRQFSGALSDNGLDSEDEEPIAGVFSNGCRVEVEADVHCLLRHDCAHTNKASTNKPIANGNKLLPPSLTCTSSSPVPPFSPGLSQEARSVTLGRRARGNGSVACQGRSQDLIEEAAEAPIRKQGGYFNAPAQPDPDDQLIIPPELEEEVRQIIQQQQQQQQEQMQTHNYQTPADYFVTPL